MRLHLTVPAVLATLLIAVTGCSSDGGSSTPATTGGPTPAAGSVPPGGNLAGSTASAGGPQAPADPAAAQSADAALSGNTKAICDQAARTSTSFGETFIADLKIQIDAASKGAAAKSQAQQKIDRDVQNYSYALADMAELTTDAALKKALTQMSAQVKALKGDVTKINADKMSQLSGTLDKACGK